MPDLTQITSPSGAKFTVAKDAADAFSGFLTDLEGAGYKIDPTTSGGYNPRNIAGTDTPSQHAFGHAIDINPASNARGAKTTSDLPANVNELAAAHGLTWGGNWSGDTRDPMHFELSGKPNVADTGPSADDLLKRMDRLAPAAGAGGGAATGAAPAPVQDGGPSGDDLLRRMEGLAPATPPPASKPTTDAAIPTPHPAAPPGPAPGTLPSYIANDPGGAIPRIGQAFMEGYQGAPDLLAPGAQATVDQWGSVPAAISRLPGTALGVLSGLYRGAQQFGGEILGDIDPRLARDVVSMPDAFAGSPHMLVPPDTGLPATMPRGPYTPPGPNLLVKGMEPPALGLGQRPAGPSERVPPDLPTAAIRSSATAKIAEDARYGDVTRSSDVVSADAVDRAVNNAIPQAEDAQARREFGKDSVVTKQIDNLQGIKGSDLSVQRWKGYDQALSDDIQTQIKQGNGPAARQLQVIQQRMRSQIENPFGDDLTSGDGSGFDSLKAARQTSAQRQKMEDVERMMALAKGRKVPQTSVQSQITNYQNNEAKSRGWGDDETAALTKAGETGEFGDLMHTLGSKLAPAIGLAPAIAESLFTHGPPSVLGMASAVPTVAATYYIGRGARGIENMLLRQRMQNALDVLGQSVPTNPLNMPPQAGPIN